MDVHISREGLTPKGWFVVGRHDPQKPWMVTVLGEHADWPQHEQRELPYLRAEETRLLHVAATRAREMLVVSRWTGQKGTAAWGALNDGLGDKPELAVPHDVSVRFGHRGRLRRRGDPLCRCDPRGRASQDVAEPSWSITSATAEARHVARMARAADAAADNPTGVVAPNTPSHRADAGVASGALVHGLLEHAMRHERVTRDDLQDLAMWLTVEEPQLQAVIDDAVDTALAVSLAKFWPEAKAGEHAVEVPFTVSLSDRALLAGVIDLAYSRPGGWCVVDYKTDLHPLDARYAEQLAAYRRALVACGLSVRGVVLESVRSEGMARP